MKEDLKSQSSFRIISAILAVSGLAVMVYGLISDPREDGPITL